jgi:hypothetical protein
MFWGVKHFLEMPVAVDHQKREEQSCPTGVIGNPVCHPARMSQMRLPRNFALNWLYKT